MRALDYAIRQAWASIWRRRGPSASAVVAIALALIVLGAMLLTTWNIERLLAQMASAAEFSVYLRDDATSEQRGAIEELIDGSGVSVGREYISKSDALVRFRQEFTELASLADGFEDNPFPASVEVRIRPESEGDGRAADLVRRVAILPGVADVRYDSEWLGRVASGLSTVRGVAFALALIMVTAAAVTVASVVRLGLASRQDELEIMQLVGSPMAFIRGPFVAEGVLQGGAGAVVAIAVLWLGLMAARGWWEPELRVLLEGDSLRFLPFAWSGALVAGGMLVGGIGGLAASRHAV